MLFSEKKMKYRQKLILTRILMVGLALVAIPFLIYKAFHPQMQQSSEESVEPHILPDSFKGLISLKPSELQKLEYSTTRFIVVFYAPGNSNNLDFLEDFNHLAESIAADIHIRNNQLEGRASYQYDPIVFGVVDCEVFGDVCSDSGFKLYGYPTTIAFNFRHHGKLLPLHNFTIAEGKESDVISKSSKWDSFRMDTLTSDISTIKAYVKDHHFTHRLPSFFYDTSEVISELSDTELEEIVESDNHKHIAVVMFYVPWCPHCKGFVTHFNEIAAAFHQRRTQAVELKRKELRTFSTEVDNLDRSVSFAAINCDVFRETCFGHGLPIEYYPTIIAFNLNRDRLVEPVMRDKLEEYLSEMYFLEKRTETMESVVGNQSETN